MLQRGDILERYEVNSLIGRGGFGFVYMGKHAELGIDVAIKEYFPSELSIREDGTVQPSKPEFRELFAEGLDRFLKEAKQLERFRECPAIVTCRDFFRANGTAYMIMDYVTGLSLASLMEQRESGGDPFTERELVDFIQPLLAGLQTVHESRVFHRDLKPSNILVRQNDGSPILIDFGAAKQETGKHTKSFAPYTDGYAAVEQVGEGNIGSWTDIYGIGAVMWRMVAGGAPPFLPPNPVPIQKRTFALSQGEADPLPTAREVGKGRFSDQILQSIDDCLIISVRDRIQDCIELSHRLDGSTVVAVGEIDQMDKDVEEVEIFGEQVANNPESDSSASRVKRGKKRTVVGASVILGLIAILGVIVFTWSRPHWLVRIAAGTGNVEAQYKLGIMYEENRGVPEDEQSAVRWYRLAADQGNIRAQYKMGQMYSEGRGVPEDDYEAVKWYRLAAEQGDVKAQTKMGLLHRYGRGLPEDYYEGERWYQLAAEQVRRDAEQGDAEAQYKMGQIYSGGRGVPLDHEAAEKWYRLAAEQGHIEAQYKMGEEKWGEEESLKWYRLAAEQGHIEAQYELGTMYDLGLGAVPEDDQEAVKWYRLAAEQGHIEAQYELGTMYDLGLGVPEDDQEAEMWNQLVVEQLEQVKKDAEQGDAEAQYKMGEEKWGEESLKWYRLAAEQGHIEAQYELGTMYDLGLRVPEDDQEAVKWYHLAAEQGHIEAQYKLGSMSEDEQESLKWYILAAEQGHATAQFFLAIRKW